MGRGVPAGPSLACCTTDAGCTRSCSRLHSPRLVTAPTYTAPFRNPLIMENNTRYRGLVKIEYPSSFASPSRPSLVWCSEECNTAAIFHTQVSIPNYSLKVF